jgi:hypothetical protein
VNEGGDKVRTQVQRALQKQTSLVRYASVTKRVRTTRAFPGALSYSIVVAGKPPTKPPEFRTRVTTGRGGGVTIWMWGVAQVQALVPTAQPWRLAHASRCGAPSYSRF